MPVHQVEEYYVFMNLSEGLAQAVKQFIESDDYNYGLHTHSFENGSLTIDGFDSKMYAKDAERQILNFIESIQEA